MCVFWTTRSNGSSVERLANNGKTPSPWSSQEIRGTVGGAMPWQCVPDRVYPVSGYGPPKNINQAAYQNRSNNNPTEPSAIKSPPPPPPQALQTPVDSNRNSATTGTEDAKNTTATGHPQQSIKSSKSFESGVLGQHANTPNGIIPWPGDHRKPRHLQWEQPHNNASYNGGATHVVYGSAYNNGEPFPPGNRSSGVRSSSRGGPTYFSPQHNHVSTTHTVSWTVTTPVLISLDLHSSIRLTRIL